MRPFTSIDCINLLVRFIERSVRICFVVGIGVLHGKPEGEEKGKTQERNVQGQVGESGDGHWGDGVKGARALDFVVGHFDQQGLIVSDGLFQVLSCQGQNGFWTSIFKFLKDEFGAIKINSLSKFRNFKQRGCVTFGHLSYIDLRAINLVQDSFHDNSYKFSFVRCPYSRSVSLYNYWINTRRMKSRVSFKDFMKTVHLRRGPIGIYNVNGLSQTNPQVDWLISGSGKFFTNKIYKIENLDDFIDDFSSRYKVNFCQKKIQ